MIHFFNPGHEAAVLNGSPYYHAPANVLVMQCDLAFLPAWYAGEGDIVLTENALPEEFLHYYHDLADWKVAAIQQNNWRHELVSSTELALWGVSPQGIHLFEKINETFGSSFVLPVWDARIVGFSHREKARSYLLQLSQKYSFIPDYLIPEFYTSLDAIEKLLNTHPGVRFLAKAPFSSSGRGLLWLPEDVLTQTERQILHGFIRRQGAVSIEYVLKRKCDFAMEFFCDGKDDCRFIGYSLFDTSSKGNYTGNRILSQETIFQHLSSRIPLEQLEGIKQSFLEFFSEDISSFYKGYVGVDMMIYDDHGTECLHPCVEINLRSNMGMLCIELQRKYIHPDAQGIFQVEYAGALPAAWENHQADKEKNPPAFLDGKMYSGYFPLCPVTPESHYRAYILLKP